MLNTILSRISPRKLTTSFICICTKDNQNNIINIIKIRIYNT